MEARGRVVFHFIDLETRVLTPKDLERRLEMVAGTDSHLGWERTRALKLNKSTIYF